MDNSSADPTLYEYVAGLIGSFLFGAIVWAFRGGSAYARLTSIEKIVGSDEMKEALATASRLADLAARVERDRVDGNSGRKALYDIMEKRLGSDEMKTITQLPERVALVEQALEVASAERGRLENAVRSLAEAHRVAVDNQQNAMILIRERMASMPSAQQTESQIQRSTDTIMKALSEIRKS